MDPIGSKSDERREVDKRARADAQVDETGLPDVGRDELGCHLDGCEEQGEVTGGGVAEPDLVVEDMSEIGALNTDAAMGVWLCTHRVRVMRSLVGYSSGMGGRRTVSVFSGLLNGIRRSLRGGITWTERTGPVPPEFDC